MKRIVIVGMGRSGTTYITEFLGKCGVFLDEVNWAQEHELARLINDTILTREFGARPGRPYGRLPQREIELSAYWHQLAQCFIRHMDAQAHTGRQSRYWAFKDPRTTVLHHIWADHFDVVVGMFRAPQEVVASYVGQGWVNGFQRRQVVLRYWKRFNQSLLHLDACLRGKKPVYILNYDGDLASQTTKLCEQLELPITPEATALFKRSLKHYHSERLPQEREAVRMYETLLAASILNR